MKTNYLKIFLPSKNSTEVYEQGKEILDAVLARDEKSSNRVSYSFSADNNSSYIMVYPTAPVLKIRISNHEQDGSDPEEQVRYEDRYGSTCINTEMKGGMKAMLEAFEEEMATADQRGNSMRNAIKRARVLKEIMQEENL